jgi:hypothetical protein
MHLFTFKIFQICHSNIHSVLEFLRAVSWRNQTLHIRLIDWIASVIAKPLHACPHSVLHELSSLNRWVIDSLSTIGTSYTTAFVLRTEMKGVVLFRSKSMGCRWRNWFFSSGKSSIGFWILLLLLAIILALLRDMVWKLPYLIIAFLISLRWLFILRFSWDKAIDLRVTRDIWTLLFNLFQAY